MKTTRCVTSAVLIALVTCGVFVPSAHAQTSNLPDFLLKQKEDAPSIASQLRVALDQSKKALAGYEAIGEAGPFDTPMQYAINAYVLMRSALAGMVHVKALEKVPNPMLELAERRTHKAWNLCRIPIDHIGWAHTKTEYFEMSTTSLRSSIRLQEQALTIWP